MRIADMATKIYQELAYSPLVSISLNQNSLLWDVIKPTDHARETLTSAFHSLPTFWVNRVLTENTSRSSLSQYI